ncbi:hypothetical protein HNP89_000604 [Methanococcus maripaludis]|uniref:DUF3467 domain-containing protein n=1 Tax=Methanococcus maripaludis TaxID=39152 RepID=A0A7J9NZC0_METMI|nr:hypothetical protein [Methanococcus maripaludis]MBA2852667.1 hypothetical protein [Methanococcus maripaludis]
MDEQSTFNLKSDVQKAEDYFDIFSSGLLISFNCDGIFKFDVFEDSNTLKIEEDGNLKRKDGLTHKGTITMTPVHAKRICESLTRTIKKYDEECENMGVKDE